jgi:futalosine hydrolase
MSEIWVTAPTAIEIESLKGEYSGKNIKWLSTGIGIVNTALSLDRALQNNRPDLIIQAGIAGSLNAQFPPGSVVQVQREIYADLGAESPSGFLDLKTLGLVNFTLNERQYFNTLDNSNLLSTHLPIVTGMTVNRVMGTAESITQAKALWNADIESMEGAAFFQVCLQHAIPFAEIRAISNWVEPRNREAWDIPAALKQLRAEIHTILTNLTG